MKAFAIILAGVSLLTMVALILVFRGNARLREENEALRRAGAVGATAKPAPMFQHRFLTRDASTNVGLANPVAALQTFLWAFVGNEDALNNVSALDENNEPVRLTGMALGWKERLVGFQPLSFSMAHASQPNVIVATVITETRTENSVKGDVWREGTAHGVLKLRFERIGDEWRFAGRER